ncbi:phage tail protein, partial [Paraburkholderia sp. 31.1]|uniref:phage tail tube protein n=1 Tax=Paraburkholderia sp. 31.1 TaxID=2615205 RepID=UPI0016565AEB
PADYERESLVGQDRVHGYAEKPRAPFISATLRDAGTLTVKDFNAMTNVTVTLELANGKTVVGRNMWSTEAQEVRTPEATFEIRFEGFSGSVTEQ